MKIKFNFWSFIASLICVALFAMAIFSKQFFHFVTNLIHIHPLYIVLTISIITFIFGLIGFAGAINKKLLLRSIFTSVISFVLSAITIFILMMASWIPFT